MQVVNANISGADSSTGTDSNNQQNASDKTFNTLLTSNQPYDALEINQQANN